MSNMNSREVATPAIHKRTVTWAVCFAALLVIAILCGLLFYSPLGLTPFFHDDSFFYLTIARNIALGFGSAFDRINPTNGYHPLYMLCLTIIGYITPLAGSHGLWVAVVLDLFLFLLGVFFVCKTLDFWRQSRMATMVGVLSLTLFLAFSNFAMDVRLLLPLTWLLIYFLSNQSKVTTGRLVFQGLLASLVVLTRLEMWILITFLAVFGVTLPIISRDKWYRAIIPTASLLVPAAFCVMIVATLNWYWFGHPYTISSWLKVGFPGVFHTDWWTGCLAGIKARLVFNGVIATMTIAYAGYILRSGREVNEATRQKLIMLTGLNLFTLTYFAFILLSLRGGVQTWYFYISNSISLVSLVTLTDDYMARLEKGGHKRLLARIAATIAVGVMLLAGTVYLSHKVRPRPHLEAGLRMALWIKRNLSPNDRIFQIDESGLTGYFSERRVINGDGLVNNFEYQKFLRSARLKEYFALQKVSYLLFQEYSAGALTIRIFLGNGESIVWNFPKPPPIVKKIGEFCLFKMDSESLNRSHEVRQAP